MYALKSVLKGKLIPLGKVNDPVFSQEILGKGVAVIPEEGKIFSPARGEIVMICETMHAFTMITDFGAELLIHIGIDTVRMNGEGFTFYVKAGDKVEEGQLLAKVNLRKMVRAGYDMVTPMVICNSSSYKIQPVFQKEYVKPGDIVLELE